MKPAKNRGATAARVDETAPALSSLAPDYSFDTHGVYFTILKSTIDKQPRVRNIALAGTYGTGKSSILSQVALAFEERVVELSLLTLGVEPEATEVGDTNPAAASKTNRIQKEIVKQLLYQQRPTKAPESRFRRIVRFRWGTELLAAAIAGSVAVGLAVIAGLDVVVDPVLGLTLSGRPHAVAVVAMLLAVALITGAMTLVVRAVSRGRLGVERVTAGPATISLPPRSTSYFDEYLDEIIYFFETNAKRDIVIIEDLDRFDDPNIFESLRSLNGLLNAAKQTGSRDIRFIYAVRDSVFEKLGREASSDATDEARAEIARANRTKFFEMVVPVVPFITHKNARDLMSTLLEERGHEVSKELVDLAARHLADMRLVHNIVNEYEVFKHRLLDVPAPVPELDADRLFAMILFKNAHMGDFEKIRHGESSLDTLWDTWRLLISANIESARASTHALRQSASRRGAATAYASKVGMAVRASVDALASAPGSGLASANISFRGRSLDDSKLTSADFWEEFTAASEPLTLQAYVHASYSLQEMQLARESLELLTGLSMSAENFIENAASDAEQRIADNDDNIAFLQRHTWEQLSDRPHFAYELHPGEPRGFRDLARAILPSELASDLVTNGYITSHFALHVSSFYGRLIRPNAMTYVMRYVDHGAADPDYPLDSDDVVAILRDQGTSVLVERSMFNIGILDHVLADDVPSAAIIVKSIAEDGSAGGEFIERYLESGARKREFVALLTPRIRGIFPLLASTDALKTDEKLELLDTAIVAREPRTRYDSSPELRAFMEEHYRQLPAFRNTAQDAPARAAADFVALSGSTLASLRGLPEPAIDELRATQAYALTRENLELISGSPDVSLDALASAHQTAFDYSVEHPAAYTAAFADAENPGSTVRSARYAVSFLKHSRGSAPTVEDIFLRYAEDSVLVTTMADVPPSTWPALARYGRAEMTMVNVVAYVEQIGEVDEDLARSLASSTISGSAEHDQAQRTALAMKILNSSAASLTGGRRATLAKGLEPGVIDATEIQPLSGPMVGDLLSAGLIADDEAAFSSRLMLDWDTQLYAIKRSEAFEDLVGPLTLSGPFVSAALRDDDLAEFHLAIAKAFPTYKSLPRAAYVAYAERALDGSYRLGASNIGMVQRGGVENTVILDLTAKFIDRIDVQELTQILERMGKPWSKVVRRGFGVTPIPDSPSARKVLTMLRDAGIVSRFSPGDGGELRVSLRQPPRDGE